MAQADVQSVVSPLASPTDSTLERRASQQTQTHTVEAGRSSPSVTRSSSFSSQSSASSFSRGNHSQQSGKQGEPGSSADREANNDSLANDGIDVAGHPDLAQAPRASFSIATKPQDREPARLGSIQQDGSRNHSRQQPPAYELDHNGRVPANDYNYMQRDRLVADAQESALHSGHDYWIRLMQLSYLASQHHLSPYSVMKFGPRGSPFAYIPITLQQPHIVEETMQRQRQQEIRAVQWLLSKRSKTIAQPSASNNSGDQEELPMLQLPSDVVHRRNNTDFTQSELASGLGNKRPASVTTPPDARVRSILRPNEDDQSQTLQVEREISEAMSLPIGPKDVRPPMSRSSSSEDSSAPSRITKDVDPSHFNRSTQIVELAGADAADESAPATPHEHPIPPPSKDVSDSPKVSTDSVSGSTIQVAGPMGIKGIMTQEMEDARPVDQSAHPNSLSISNDVSHVGALSLRDQNHLATKTSDTHPIHISPVLPEALVKEISQRVGAAQTSEHLLPSASSTADGDTQSREVASTHSYMDMEAHSQAQVYGRRLIRLRNPLNLATITSVDPGSSYMSQSQLAEQAAREAAMLRTSAPKATETTAAVAAAALLIGNLLLSSCPGKKVRLSGPVRGRGAICRDLGLDLKRIFGIGVRAIVCCLDDDELSYLGAPWEEYEKEADALGLEVIRLPMAEGFAPTDVRQMDTVITSIVTDYTMKGTDVLVHCRGGVGRAGLIACAWMLKMGFVGTPSRIKPQENPAIDSGHPEGYSTVGQETARGHQLGSDLTNIMTKDAESEQIIDTVRSLIETIRRRRSPKAIETAEQVRFLVELVTFLHRQEQLRTVSAPASS